MNNSKTSLAVRGKLVFLPCDDYLLHSCLVSLQVVVSVFLKSSSTEPWSIPTLLVLASILK